MAAYRRDEQAVAWSLVAVQAVLLAGLVFAPGARVWAVPLWLADVAIVMIAAGGVAALVGAAGLGAGLTASPLPSAAARLRTTGLYAWVRHPIYSGLLLAGAGVVLLGGRLSRVAVWAVLLLLLWGKSRFEERKLAARFPGYRDYEARTPRLIPHPRRYLTRHTTTTAGEDADG